MSQKPTKFSIPANIFNKVSPATSPTASQDEAKNRALASSLQLAANVAGGQGIDPTMSGFQQALAAGLQGGAQGFTNKADIQKATAQDEYNAWAKSLQEYEMEQAKRLERNQKDTDALKRLSTAIVSARIQYSQTGDKATFEKTMQQLGRTYASLTNREFINGHLNPDNDIEMIMSLKDLDDGQMDTQPFLQTDALGYVLEQDAELGREGARAFGLAVPEEKPTGVMATIQDAEKALGRPLEEKERMKLLKLDDSAAKGKQPTSSIFGKKGNEELQKKRAAVLNGSPERAAALGRISQVQELLASGTQTGALTELSSQALGVLGTALGVDFSSVSNVSQLNALLKGQLGGVLSIFGAGTGISNRDVENAQLIIGSVENPADALRKIQAYAAANLRLSEDYANALREVDLLARAGDIDEVEAERRIAAVESQQFERIQSLYNEELDKALSMQQNYLRTGSTSGAETAPQEIEIDLDGNIIQ